MIIYNRLVVPNSSSLAKESVSIFEGGVYFDLFKGGNYSRKYSIYIYIYIHTRLTLKKVIPSLKISLLHSSIVMKRHHNLTCILTPFITYVNVE